MMTSKFTHNKAQFFHTRKRLQQRFSIELNEEDYRWLCRSVVKKEAEFLIEQVNPRTSFWKINYKGQDVILLYDMETRAVKSAWTTELFEKQKIFILLKKVRTEDGFEETILYDNPEKRKERM